MICHSGSRRWQGGRHLCIMVSPNSQPVLDGILFCFIQRTAESLVNPCQDKSEYREENANYCVQKNGDGGADRFRSELEAHGGVGPLATTIFTRDRRVSATEGEMEGSQLGRMGGFSALIKKKTLRRVFHAFYASQCYGTAHWPRYRCMGGRNPCCPSRWAGRWAGGGRGRAGARRRAARGGRGGT